MQTNGFQKFLSKFAFQKERTDFVGVERERFLSNHNTLVPRSANFLGTINDAKWTCELSACQVEDRTEPYSEINKIHRAMLGNDIEGGSVARQLGLTLKTIEVADENMPLDIYPEPRYLQIAESITKERLSAACRVTGTHIHIGMPNISKAIHAYNTLLEHLDEFCGLGDHSQGQRLELYKTMAINWDPPHYDDAQHFFERAKQENFSDNPCNCWDLIRISIHGTVELRMFGVTECLEEICWWVEEVKKDLP